MPQESLEGVLISKISSSLTPLSLLYLVKTAQNKINPRTATVFRSPKQPKLFRNNQV